MRDQVIKVSAAVSAISAVFGILGFLLVQPSAHCAEKKTALAPFMLEGTFADGKVEGMEEAPSRFRVTSPNSAREGVLELFGEGLYCKYALNLVVPQPSFFQLQTLRFQGDRAECKPGYPASVRGVINLEQAHNQGQIRLIDERLKKENALTVKTALQK